MAKELDLSRVSVSDKIYSHLRLELMTGLHAPGSRMSIRKLASELGVSPTPVREAIFQLVREGALELRTGHQPRVPDIDVDRYLLIRQTRVPLERLAGELAAARIEPEALDQLAAYHEVFCRSEETHAWGDALKANQDFHFTIYHAAQNEVLVRTIENLWLLAGPVFNAQYPRIDRSASETDPHILIMDALRRRSPSEAGNLLVQDMLQGSERILEHL